MTDSFFPARCVYMQFEKFEQAEYMEASDNKESKAVLAEKHKLAHELKDLIENNKSLTSEQRNSTWIEGWIADPTTKVEDIQKQIEFGKASNREATEMSSLIREFSGKKEHTSIASQNIFKKLLEDYYKDGKKYGPALKEFLDGQFNGGRLALTVAALHKYKQYEGLAGVKNIRFKKPITLTSENGKTIQINGWIDQKVFAELTLEQKKGFFEAITNPENQNNPSADPISQALTDKYLADTNVPQSWKEWLKNPGDPKWGVDSQGKKWTVASIAEWIGKELPDLKLSTGRYEHILEEGRHTINKNGIQMRSVEEFQKLSRGERNEYLNSLQGKLASVDTEFAKRMETAKVTEGAAAKTIGTEMAESAKKKDEKLEKKVVETGKKIEQSPVLKNLRQKFAERKAELEKRTKESELTEDTSNLRQQAMEGGASPLQLIFANTPIAKFFGGGKKREAANDATGEEAAQKLAEQKRIENEAANQIVTETIGDGKDNKGDPAAMLETEKMFGLSSLAKQEDKANVLKFLITANFNDPKQVRETLNDRNGPFRRMFETGISTLLDDEPQTQKAA